MAIFSAKGNFPYILKFRLRVIACKMKSCDNWETYDPILERGKMGLQHISKWTKSIFFGWTPPYTLKKICNRLISKLYDFFEYQYFLQNLYTLAYTSISVSLLSLYLDVCVTWEEYDGSQIKLFSEQGNVKRAREFESFY